MRALWTSLLPCVCDIRISEPSKGVFPAPVTCVPTPAPSINPTTSFIPFGVRQRCLEASRLAPFEDRRLASSANMDELALEGGRRLNPVISTPSDCYTYC